MHTKASFYRLLQAVRKTYEPFVMGEIEIDGTLFSNRITYDLEGENLRLYMYFVLSEDDGTLHINTAVPYDIADIDDEHVTEAIQKAQRYLLDTCSLVSVTLNSLDREDDAIYMSEHATVYFGMSSDEDALPSQVELLEGILTTYFDHLENASLVLVRALKAMHQTSGSEENISKHVH